MTESSVNYLLNKLTNSIENEWQFLRGHQEEVIALRCEFEHIRAFLRVADSLEEIDEEARVWVRQLRDVVHQTEDALDELKLLSTQDHGPGFSGFIIRCACCIRNMKARHRISSEIQRLRTRIKTICEGHQRLRQKFIRAEKCLGSIYADNTWQDNRGNALLLDKGDLVGIEERKNRLVQQLVDGGPRKEVTPVVGMGGLGKSTLVKQVYEDPTVKKLFPLRAWITLSRSMKVKDLMEEMLNQIMEVMRKPVPSGTDAMSGDLLKMIVKDFLQRRRYLIVLDDVWNMNEWDAVKHALPNNNCGSRIIITTRDSNLAHASCTEFTGKVYEMEPLPDDLSWELFCRKTFQGNHCPPHLEETCKYILQKCDGLPLAIVAISGVLATKDKGRIDEWDVVRRSLRSEIDGNDRLKNLKKVLSLSFNDLPYYLKSCFLHMSVFPEGHLIERKRLLRHWMSEGFVEPKEGKTIEDVAKDYFRELLNRSLLQVVETRSDGRIITCRINGVLQEIITSKSSDHGFATVVREQSNKWSDKVRRLAIHDTLESVQKNRSFSQIRSLYLFGVDRSFIASLLACGLKLINVLDLQAAPLFKFPVQVVDWYFLRYLSFRNTEIKSVPNTIGKLQNLETLDLKHTKVTELPPEILKLKKLRHLLVYRYEIISYCTFKYGFKALTGIGALQSLQKLTYIEADDENNAIIMKEIGKLTQLTRLGMLKLRKEDGEALCLSIEKLTKLRAMSVSSFNDEEVLDLQHLSYPPPLLQRVYLRGRLGKLPHWLSSHCGLSKLHLGCSQLKKDPLASLQNLPSLIHLELLQVYNWKVLHFEAKSFNKLRILGLDNFEELTCVEVEEGAMPLLEEWIIQQCKSLKKLPSGIEHLSKLKVLQFFDMPDELTKKFLQEEEDEDYQKVEHISEVYFGYWRDGGWDVQFIERSPEGNSSARAGTHMKSGKLPPCWK